MLGERGAKPTGNEAGVESPEVDEQMGEAYQEQVAVLLLLATEGVRMQPAADAAIRACASSADAVVPTQVAVDLGEALRTYSRLYHHVASLDPDPDLVQTIRDLRGQLSYHLHMLRDAGDFVFCPRPTPANDRFRRELGAGLGPHAQGLCRLHSALAARYAILC
jgi:hypothetical protein